MGFIGLLALLAGCAVIYCSWSILKYAFTVLVKFFVFIGMVCFVGLLLLLFVGGCMGVIEQGNSQLRNIKTNSIVIPSAAGINPSYGIPVPFKKGFIRSPYSCKGIIDARGIPPNTEIKDPYSGKIILVP